MRTSQRVIDDGTKKVRSLVWAGDDLVDWCQGGVRWDAEGKRHVSGMMTTYSFDAAVVSPAGDYYCIFTRTGTKGVIGRTSDKKHLREINRSYYFADVYEFPVTFARWEDGQQVIIYCPEKYNRLEIEDVATGEQWGYHPATNSKGPASYPHSSKDTAFDVADDVEDLANRESKAKLELERKPSDVFHSRLAVSPSGRWLLSNGWYWHPHETVEVFPLQDCVANARLLDKRQFVPPGCPLAHSAAFLDDDRLLLGFGEGWYDEQGEEVRGQTGKQALNTLAVWRIGEETYESVCHLERQTGTLIPLGEEFVLDLFEFPQVIDLRNGEIVHQWPEIQSGRQASCITRDQHPPPTAFDPLHRRLAVHCDEKIHILQFEGP